MSLMDIFSGWDGYQTSLAHTIAELSVEQLKFRSAPDLRSVGEIAEHIASGRVDWFRRMGAPGADMLYRRMRGKENTDDTATLVQRLNESWEMVESNLKAWTVEDLSWTYHQPYLGKTYVVSRQWVIWRIMAHDIHHGGQISAMLMPLGVEMPELGDNGGHIIETHEVNP